MKLFYLLLLSLFLIFSPFKTHADLIAIPGHAEGGFFCNFFAVVGALDLEVENGNYEDVAPMFGKDHFYYDESHGHSWWHYYFQHIIIPDRRCHVDFSHAHRVGDFAVHAKWDLGRERCNYLINKYIRVKPEILDEVQKIVESNFSGTMVGIHYRGTDKKDEIRRVDYKEVFDLMKELETTMSDCRFFIASDEQNFIDECLIQFLGKAFAMPYIRSIDENPIHHKNMKEPYKTGREALIDCLLLSRCHLMIGTGSNLSDAAQCFNTSLQVNNTLNRERNRGLPHSSS